jgi:uncharacterized protein
MRLTSFEINAIKKIASKYFAPDYKIFLFGSRVDDTKKGGDIDLFVQRKDESVLTLQTKLTFLVELKLIIGEQKIDVVFDNHFTRQKTAFYQSILETKVELDNQWTVGS